MGRKGHNGNSIDHQQQKREQRKHTTALRARTKRKGKNRASKIRGQKETEQDVNYNNKKLFLRNMQMVHYPRSPQRAGLTAPGVCSRARLHGEERDEGEEGDKGEEGKREREDGER